MLHQLHKTPLAVEAKTYGGVNSGRVRSDCHAKIYKMSIQIFAETWSLQVSPKRLN
jgi:hypothetical protein